jgi:hypothetical protein
MSAHLEKTPVPPVEVDPRLPQGLNDAILMSVAKDPALRFQTAGAFRAALGSVLPARQTAPVGPPILQTAARPAAPVITQPMASAVPGFQPTPPAPVSIVAAKPRGKRGLWMAVGALAAALGAIAVIEFGPWKDTKAQTQQSQAQPAQTVAPQTQPAQPVQAPAQATAQPAATTTPPNVQPQPVQQTAPAQTFARAKNGVAKPVATAGNTAVAIAQPQQMQPAVQTPIPAQAPTQQPIQQPAAQPAAAQPAGPSRAELQASREHYVMLDSRASGVHTSLQSLQRSLGAGSNLSSKFTQPASLMDSYMRGANDALRDSDLVAAKDFMDKAERQLEILEKLLNR